LEYQEMISQPEENRMMTNRPKVVHVYYRCARCGKEFRSGRETKGLRCDKCDGKVFAHRDERGGIICKK